MALQTLPQGFDYACFVSFSQRDREADREEFDYFLDRLHARLAANAKLNSKGETYYLLNEHAAAGDFRDMLKSAMTSSVCLVSLYSPNYWASEECAWERGIFIDRNLGRKLGRDTQRGIDCFAVPWRLQPTDNRANTAERVIPLEMPRQVADLSYFRREADCPAIYREGLNSVMLRKDEASKQEVERYIFALADEMCKLIDKLRRGMVALSPMRRGYLYVLASGPLDIQDKLLALADETEANLRSEVYTMSGGPDWHPFTPGDPARSIGRIVGDVVKNEMRGQVCELVSHYDMTTTLRTAIRTAADHQEYAIVVIDPLSIHHFEGMQSILDGFDASDYRYRNLLLVIVRDTGSETASEKASLDETIEKFFHHFLDDTDWYFVNAVRTEEEFTDQLKSNFVKLRSKMQASPRRQIDSSGPRTPATL